MNRHPEQDAHTTPGTGSDATLRGGDWESIRILNSYRLFIAIALLAAFLAAVPWVEFGATAPRLFYIASAFYLVFGLIFTATIHRRAPSADIQARLHLYTDLVILAVITYASGGVGSGLGTLLVVPVAGAGTLLAPRHALLAAALGTLLILGIEVARQFGIDPAAAAYPQAALLGITLFAAALLASGLALRSQHSAELARRRSADVQRLSALNERIVQQMESGILVVDDEDGITLANASAGTLLEQHDRLTGRDLGAIAPRIRTALEDWRREGRTTPAPLAPSEDSERRLQVQFSPLGEAGTLVSLEDAHFIEEQVQQLKLASLGRLTASIAHEIRNPLAAISHSTQLLRESEALDDGDRRLTDIVVSHCRRVNDIVESVLELSRRRQSGTTSVALAEWLPDFAGRYAREHGLSPERIACEAGPDLPTVHFDLGQLEQIVRNLCDNSLHHGRRSDGGSVIVTLCAGRSSDGRAWLDVRDDGAAIDAGKVDDLFEPFFTTSHSGTGLGLFLARELCEANRARLQFVRGAGGNCFRLNLQTAEEALTQHG